MFKRSYERVVVEKQFNGEWFYFGEYKHHSQLAVEVELPIAKTFNMINGAPSRRWHSFESKGKKYRMYICD